MSETTAQSVLPEKPANYKLHIMMVDDDPDLGLMLKTLLEYHGGHEVTIYRKAEDVLTTLRSATQLPDLLITDEHLLSDTTGTQLIETLRKDPSKRFSDIAFIITSNLPIDNPPEGIPQFLKENFGGMMAEVDRIAQSLA